MRVPYKGIALWAAGFGVATCVAFGSTQGAIAFGVLAGMIAVFA